MSTAFLELEPWHYRVFVAVLTGLAFVHAHRKLSPYFAATWFGAAGTFAWIWAKGVSPPESFLLPGLVVYMAAAITKGVVETRDGVRGNHFVHVVMTGLFTGLLVLPFEAAARAMTWNLPHYGPGDVLGLPSLGGVPSGSVVLWMVVGFVFYGTYKVLDHIGIGPAVQAVAVFAVTPFLARVVWFVQEAL